MGRVQCKLFLAITVATLVLSALGSATFAQIDTSSGTGISSGTFSAATQNVTVKVVRPGGVPVAGGRFKIFKHGLMGLTNNVVLNQHGANYTTNDSGEFSFRFPASYTLEKREGATLDVRSTRLFLTTASDTNWLRGLESGSPDSVGDYPLTTYVIILP